MADVPSLSHTSAMILQAIGAGHIYGYTVMEVTGLPSGTVYPALRRMERDKLIRAQWERQSIAEALSVAGRTDSTRGGPGPMKTEWLQYTVLRAASLLAPGDQRAEWVKEW